MNRLFYRIGIVLYISGISMAHLFAQTQSISGIITSSETGESVSYCSIFIKGSQLGTTANADGDFVFVYPDSVQQDTLVISAIGFHVYEILLDTLQVGDSLNIQLLPNPYTLDKVLVFSEEVNAREILENAIKKIRKNYSKKPYYLKAFFREMSFQDAVYQRLIEAAVSIHDPGVRTSTDRIRVKVDELRKSEDYRELSLLQRGLKFFAGSDFNSLVSLLKWDAVRYHQSEASKPWATSKVWLRERFLESYKFEIVDIVREGEEEYFKIQYAYADSLKFTEKFLQEGSILVHTQNYGIRQFDFMLRNNSRVYKSHMGLGKEKFLFKLLITYQMHQGIYYPNKMLLTSSGTDGMPFNFDIVRDNKGYAGGLRGTTYMLQVNEVITNKKQMEKIRKKEMERKGVDLYDKDFTYNEAFWRGYNAVPVDRKYISAKKDLEQQESLNEQFLKNK